MRKIVVRLMMIKKQNKKKMIRKMIKKIIRKMMNKIKYQNKINYNKCQKAANKNHGIKYNKSPCAMS